MLHVPFRIYLGLKEGRGRGGRRKARRRREERKKKKKIWHQIMIALTI